MRSIYKPYSPVSCRLRTKKKRMMKITSTCCVFCQGDPDLAHVFPIEPTNAELLLKLRDGELGVVVVCSVSWLKLLCDCPKDG